MTKTAIGSRRRTEASQKSAWDDLDMLKRRFARAGWSCQKMGWLIGIIPLLCAIGIWFSWRQDEVVLEQRAEHIIKDLHIDSARIRAINDWAYHNKGFAKNDRYFFIS